MKSVSLYPLTFHPIFQYRIWGGRRLSDLLHKPLPSSEHIGEAWVLSDREDSASVVSNGLYQGRTITELMRDFPEQLMGDAAGRFDKFPLLLKFLDAQTVLSVQVHPADGMEGLPEGESGKTEAWVVLDANEDSRIYAGLKQGVTRAELEGAIQSKQAKDFLPSFKPEIGDAIYIPAGTVHTFDNVLLFEVQENSDVTYRLYDWDRIDEKTGKTREIHLQKALDCIDFSQGPIKPVIPHKIQDTAGMRELLFDCAHFKLWRVKSSTPFSVGDENLPRMLVCVEGDGHVKSQSSQYALNKGEVMLLPAICGISTFTPRNEVILFEIALPE